MVIPEQIPRIVFFTGTDTGVGKTAVVCAAARALRASGVGVGVCKPVASGAARSGDGWLSDDTLELASAVGLDPVTSDVTRWVFPEPVAPNVAARMAGVRLDLKEIADWIVSRADNHEILLVEGVGGVLCPLTDSATVADLIAALDCPVVVVARRSLGTLNHTLMTLEVARGRGLDVRGVIVSETVPPRELADRTNVEELGRLADVPILAVLAHQDTGLAGTSLPTVDWQRLASPRRHQE